MAKRVFVVDDNNIILRFVALHLGEAGFDVHTSSNPLTVAMEVGRCRPDLVLLDVEMPAIRGTQVLAALRRTSCHSTVKIVLFSSLAPEVLAQLSDEYGAAGWIRKASPLDAAALVRQVGELLAAPGARTRPKAIVADDSRAMRRILTGSLTNDGFDVFQAGDGLELDELLRRMPGVDLLLLDINMPELDGARLVRRVRAEGSATRILLVTCESDLGHVRRVQSAGANDYLLKPFTSGELKRTIRRVMEAGRATAG